jgi:S1-C subfamily serine protease
MGGARSPAAPEYPVRSVQKRPRPERAITIDPSDVAAAVCRGFRGVDTVNAFLAKIVAWINAGYPEGVPGPDRVPLMSLLNRRLTNDEVKAVAGELINRGEFDHVDIGVLITQTTDELPRPEDVERVRERLAARGWPLDDPREEGSSIDGDGEGSA